MNSSTLSVIINITRRVVGFTCLGIWALGAILPIIPGWPALIVAIVLLGRRDRTLRFLHLIGRKSLRWLRQHRTPRIRTTGRWLSEQYLSARRALTPALIRAERTFQF
jgi:hypothetical protein